VFELFSVNVHSGGALGGHYYDLIKSFESSKWYKFDDSRVSSVQRSEVKNYFGEFHPEENSGTSAYLLMYRRVSLEEDAKMPEIPEN
jgi:ubiquitin carboxyl-terminal hydrolase 47